MWEKLYLTNMAPTSPAFSSKGHGWDGAAEKDVQETEELQTQPRRQV